ncbi:HEPN domain-containing protein [Micromonospora sp. NPDC093277]|uniref:ApeA N-terminal domain 1-containing protein n=1 Tax=Micromonospora sp. NPDC093277 TaxID=3364291 RepID=UPI00380648DF
MLGTDQQNSFVGQWWIPNEPSKVSWGKLDIRERVELELHETIDDWRALGRGDPYRPAVIHGVSGGFHLTLLDNVQISLSTTERGGVGQARRVVVASTVLVGDSHLETEEDRRFDRAAFRLTNLDQWVNRNGYSVRHSPTEAIEVLEVPQLKAVIPGGAAYLWKSKSSTFDPKAGASLSSQETIELKLAERHSLDDISYRYVRPFEQLLTLATGVQCEALNLHIGIDDPAAEWLNKWPGRHYEVRGPRAETLESQPVIRHHMRFGMNTPGFGPNVDFGEIVPRWFSLQEKLSYVCDLIFSLRTKSSGYLQQQMFTIASAIEGLHRGLNPLLERKTTETRARNKEILDAIESGCPNHRDWLAGIVSTAHRPSYAFRVKELLQRTDHRMVEIVGDEEVWTRELRKMRDGIGHVLSAAEDGKAVHEMIAMLRSAQFLAELVLLRELGFSDADCQQALDHRGERESRRSQMERSFPAWFSGSLVARD